MPDLLHLQALLCRLNRCLKRRHSGITLRDVLHKAHDVTLELTDEIGLPVQTLALRVYRGTQGFDGLLHRLKLLDAGVPVLAARRHSALKLLLTILKL